MMESTIPPNTYAAEVSATVDELERGLTEIPLSKGINRIDDWRREVLASDRADLVPVADALGELRESLVGEGRDSAVIGGLLVRLGDLTEAAAPSAHEATRDRLLRLASLLRHAGSALV